MNKKMITCIPNASSLIESMRSIGYSFDTALADIIDNSISAQAKNIQIFSREIDGNPYIQIIDDGSGMNRDELIEAMRLGSKNPVNTRDSKDLGRFGLGLKSASFSQCRLLTVVSKKDGQLSCFQWDLDIIAKTNNFEIRQLEHDEIEQIPNIEVLDSYIGGTIVQWEIFDRIFDSSKDLMAELAELMNLAIEHVSLIFHRFLTAELNIEVNFEKVIAKDPFLLKHPATQERKIKKVMVDGEVIKLNPYVLPHYTKLSASDKRKIGKNNELHKEQGFYLYRNRRLIIWGDYLGLAKKTELGKNLRIQVDIPNSLDYLWEIDVKKSRASVPSKIKKNLISVITDGEIVSKRVSSFRGTKELSDDKPIWQFYSERDNEFHFEINKEQYLYDSFVSTLDEQQKKIFDMLTKSIEENIPFQKIYVEIADGNHTVKQEKNEMLEELLESLSVIKHNKKINYTSFLESLLSTEPYMSSENALKIINSEMENLNGKL